MKYRTKQELIYAELRQRIISGQLKPGQRLIISAIAQEMNCSEIPVREAIKLLQSEELVTSVPHAGAVVATLSQRDVEEINQIRALLEPFAVKLTTPLITAEDLQQLEQLMDEMAEAVAAGDVRAYGEKNRAFHMFLTQKCPNEQLRSLLQRLWDQDRGRAVFKLVDGHMERSHQGHIEVLAAIRAGDADAAEAAMARHRAHALQGIKHMSSISTKQFEEVSS